MKIKEEELKVMNEIQAAKMQKEMDIQQLKFAGGHPPNYYAAGRMLKYARADGMACSHSPVVVCAEQCFLIGYELNKLSAMVAGTILERVQVQTRHTLKSSDFVCRHYTLYACIRAFRSRHTVYSIIPLHLPARPSPHQ